MDLRRNFIKGEKSEGTSAPDRAGTGYNKAVCRERGGIKGRERKSRRDGFCWVFLKLK